MINFFNKSIFDEKILQFFVDSLSKTFNDTYAFNIISKNPPNQNYYKKVDIVKLIQEIKTKNRSLYSFYQDLSNTFSLLGDSHIYLNLTKYLALYNEISFSQPLKLYIKMYDNKPRFFGTPFHHKNFWQYFKNYTTVYNTINKNLNVQISSINGMDPFDYINSFGSNYNNLKSPYATFVYKYMNHNNMRFYLYPLSIDDLTNFTVVYDNNQTFTTDFIVTCPYDTTIIKLDNLNDNIRLENQKVNLYDSLNDYDLKTEKFNNSDNNFTNDNSVLKDNKTKSFNESLRDKVIQWNYNYYNICKCRVDEEKNVNVYYISSYGGTNEIQALSQVILKYSELFDTNQYPIILINSFNSGGQSYLAQILLELFSPKITVNVYGAFRKTETFQNSTEMNQYLSNFMNSENCETLTYDHLMKKEHIVNYADNISDTLTETIILLGKEVKKQLNEVKKNFKNPRNPTDILVYTDGYSYSAASIFLKYLQYYGGGITAGYFYNPNLKTKNIPFDNSSSPSMIYDYIRLYMLNPERYKPFYDYFNFQMKLPGIQTFYSQIIYPYLWNIK